MRTPLLLAVAVAGIARADSLDDVLARMDTAAKAFQSYSANVKVVDYTNIIDEAVPSAGSMRFKRDKKGVVGIVDFNSGDKPFTIRLDGSNGERYIPKANLIQEFNLRKLGATVDQMLLLGFNTTREELLRDYGVKLGGPEKVDSAPTTRIVLTPKSEDTLKVAKTIELWIPDGKGYPTQIKENAPNKDYHLATFSNMKLNPDLPPSAFELPPEAARAKRTKVN